jgi:hypothetical protein
MTVRVLLPTDTFPDARWTRQAWAVTLDAACASMSVTVPELFLRVQWWLVEST